MPTAPFTHFVFVDFENVPSVDLGLVEGKSVHVTLLIGKKQTKLDTSLSIQFNKFAGQVTPVEVNASGRNALDMVLACHLGRSVERNPGAQFTIVSRDKDFEPVLGHLSGEGVRIVRCDTFAAAFQPASPKPGTASRPPFVATRTPAKTAAPNKPKPVADRFGKFVQHLRNSPPANKTKLEHMIEAYFKPTLPAGGKKGIIARLLKERVVEIDSAQKVKVV